jgi:ribosomal protein L37E
MNNTDSTAAQTKAHNLFECRCSRCNASYHAWCDVQTTVPFDSRWARYDNWSVKTLAEKRGFVSNGDLLACGYSINEIRDIVRKQRKEAA